MPSLTSGEQKCTGRGGEECPRQGAHRQVQYLCCLNFVQRGHAGFVARLKQLKSWDGGRGLTSHMSESELLGADPIGYGCVERSKQSKITCKGSA
eukprot:362932-Chlamydomonas_euryale.AAC.7